MKRMEEEHSSDPPCEHVLLQMGSTSCNENYEGGRGLKMSIVIFCLADESDENGKRS